MKIVSIVPAQGYEAVHVDISNRQEFVEPIILWCLVEDQDGSHHIRGATTHGEGFFALKVIGAEDSFWYYGKCEDSIDREELTREIDFRREIEQESIINFIREAQSQEVISETLADEFISSLPYPLAYVGGEIKAYTSGEIARTLHRIGLPEWQDRPENETIKQIFKFFVPWVKDSEFSFPKGEVS